MASVYKDRYGIPGPDVTNLVRKFYRNLYNSDWETADAFVKWCSENGWKSGLRLCRIDTSKPHGPENSYFKTPEMTKRAIQEDNRRRKEDRKNTVIPFCKGCQKTCSNTAQGCKEYRKWFAKNWNKNIYVPPVKPPEPVKQQFFCYEHPDLVREGIVWTGT